MRDFNPGMIEELARAAYADSGCVNSEWQEFDTMAMFRRAACVILDGFLDSQALEDDEIRTAIRNQSPPVPGPPLTAKTIVWQNRLVKMLDSWDWAMSRAGNHEDFDFSPAIADETMAVAGNFEALNVYDFEALDENRLLFHTGSGAYELIGNPAGRDCRIEWRTRAQVPLPRDWSPEDRPSSRP